MRAMLLRMNTTTDTNMSNAPTKNATYNDLLTRWAAAGHACTPECEDCGRDLTGQDVIETAYNWICADCAQQEPSHVPYADWREDFHSDI
jgi:hypothetical protein